MQLELAKNNTYKESHGQKLCEDMMSLSQPTNQEERV